MLLADHPVGGFPLPRLRRLLEEWAADLRLPPRHARLDPAEKARVPHLEGLAVDVEGNLRAAAAAPPGARLSLLLPRVPAEPAADDLPLAPVRRGNPHRRAVALAINVDWGEELLPALLAALAARGVRATFFLTGRWAETHPAAARTLAVRHEVASHGYAATDALASRSAAEHRRDLARAEAAILRVTGKRPRLFSPHKGQLPPALLRAAAERRYTVILWDVDTVDWTRPGADAIEARVLGRVRAGSIILMHPTPDSLAVLDRLVVALWGRGYRLLSVGELLNPDPRGALPASAEGVAPPRPPGRVATWAPGTGGRGLRIHP